MVLKTLGYCEWPDERLAQLLGSGRAKDVLAARGQFVIVAEDSHRTTIITSRHGVQHYYYTTRADSVIHGDTVLGVCARADLPFKWNFRAVADALTLDHTVGDDTLTPDVQRTSPGSVLVFECGRVTSDRDTTFTDPAPYSASDLCANLQTEMLVWWKQSTDVLCLTGGLDSRLLLSVLLSCGMQPRLLVCGHEESYDLKVARSIARKFGLELVECEVTPADFLADAEGLVRRTNGLLPVSHWPGVLFSRFLQGARLFLGFNGEAGRSYYDPHGFPSILRARLSSHGYSARNLWRQRTTLPLSERERGSLHPELRAALEEDGWQDRMDRLMPKHFQLGDALDHVFTNARTPNKSGIDVSAISLHTRWIVPLCSDSWVSATRKVSRVWKQWDLFHRNLIHRLEPRLLQFPTDTTYALFGTVPGRSRNHFFDQRHYRNPELVEYCANAIDELHELFDVTEWPNWSARLRERLSFSLASMGLWRRMQRREHLRLGCHEAVAAK